MTCRQVSDFLIPRLWRGILLTCWASLGFAQTYPPLTVEIGPYHPLFLFHSPGEGGTDTDSYSQSITGTWAALPEALRPFSAMVIDASGVDPTTRQARYLNLLKLFQESEVPVVLHLADADPRRTYPLDLAEELVAQFTTIKGLEVANLSFNEYYTFAGSDAFGTPPNVRWLMGAADLAARYGRFLAVRLDGVEWLRVMTNSWCRPLVDTFRTRRAYLIPLVGHGRGDTIAQQGALMGLWLEGVIDQWGVAPSSDWYAHANFIEPGVFGNSTTGPGMPAGLYRAMILNGALGGACVYAFPAASDLWVGERKDYWTDAILPTLEDITGQSLIAGKEFVAKKVRVAYQLSASRSPQEFHLNLRDLDGVRDQGLMIRGAYGMERPGQITELIPNSGRHYWVPIVSPYAPSDVLDAFARVVRPGSTASAQAWIELLDQYLGPDGSGSAFIVRVGRGIFVMNTRENLYEEQAFRIPEAPAPVRAVEAVREGNAVTLSWPFREGDVSYSVFKRLYPAGEFEQVARNIDERTWTDPAADSTASVAYAVTALTNEREPCEGTVNYGEYLAFSTVESRIDEEAVLTPLVAKTRSRPLEKLQEVLPKSQEWWPSFPDVPEKHMAVARELAARIEQWDEAFVQEDLDGVMDLYSTNYQDPQWWQFQYAKRAYQWLFERYSACKMSRQLRQWDFADFDADGEARLLLYCRFTGVAISDPSGRVADVPAWFPRSENGEVWLTFTNKEGKWRIERTDPALPNFAEILSFSTGPYDSLPPGPDVYGR